MLANNPILAIHIDDLNILQRAYMPFFKNGGIFLPTATGLSHRRQALANHRLNDRLCLLLRLFDNPQPHCCIVKIVWVSPAKPAAGFCSGLGLQFGRPDSPIKSLIESRLANHETEVSRSHFL